MLYSNTSPPEFYYDASRVSAGPVENLLPDLFLATPRDTDGDAELSSSAFDESSFTIHRKLLRRRHVRKEQKQKRKEREAAGQTKRCSKRKISQPICVKQPSLQSFQRCCNTNGADNNGLALQHGCTAVTPSLMSPPRIILRKYPMDTNLPAFSPVRSTQRCIRRLQETCH